MDVQELSIKEQKEIEGGWLWVELWGGFNFVNISDYNSSDWNKKYLV